MAEEDITVLTIFIREVNFGFTELLKEFDIQVWHGAKIYLKIASNPRAKW